MKFIITQELFNEMLELMSQAEFSKVMNVIKAVTANPYEQESPKDNEDEKEQDISN